MARNFFNTLVKYRILVIFSSLLIGFIILVVLIFVLTYVNNKPVVFKNEDAKVLKPKNLELFDVNVNVIELKPKKENADGTIKYSIELTNLKEDIKNVNVETQLNTNWVNTLTEGSSYKFEKGGTLYKNNPAYVISNASSTIRYDYPIKVLPFVKVSNPNIYLKITYTKVSPTILSDEQKTETVYVVYEWDDYFTSTSKYA